MSSQNLQITRVTPAYGVPGGEIVLDCLGFKPGLPQEAKVLVGEVEASIASASQDRVIVRLPDNPQALGISLKVGEITSPIYPFSIAERLASELHPVTSPVVARDGTIVTTISGTRGQQVAQPLVGITRSGEKTHFPCEITNPTGLALGSAGELYISSRNDGVLYRYNLSSELEVVAEDLGIACGLALDSQGRVYVGDRSGRIIRLFQSGGREIFASLEPSISAYHLVMDAEDNLYVTGPTLSMRDHLSRISPKGQVDRVFSGLARPQGMALHRDGYLLLAAAYEGNKGIFRFFPRERRIEHFISAPTLVGVAFAGDDIVLTDHTSVYLLPQAIGDRSRVL